jgi:hypothetical protein
MGDAGEVHYSQKKYEEMTDRDWKIFREVKCLSEVLG